MVNENEEIYTPVNGVLIGHVFLNVSHRWFDKSFHMAVSKNGKLAINQEHAWGDGVTVVRFLNETVEASAKDNFTPDPKAADTKLTMQKLDFNLDNLDKEAIKKG